MALTYISTNDLIRVKGIVTSSCCSGVLFPIEPQIKSDRIIRNLYVSSEINKMLEKSQEAEWGTARAIMDTFVSGGLISVPCKKTKNKPRHHIARLDPEDEGVWDMRATKPKPGIRIVGQFVTKDFFIALAWQKRILLDHYYSKEWRNIILSCQTKWRNIFTAYPPMKGGDYHDYISNIFPN